MDFFKNATSDILVGCIVLLISIASICGGAYMYVQNDMAYENFVKTDAVIVDYETQRGYKDGVMKYYYIAIMKFKADDQTYTVKSARSTDPVKIGTKVEIFYNPDNPEEIVIPEKNNQSAILLFAFGALALFAGSVFLICGIKVRSKLNTTVKE